MNKALDNFYKFLESHPKAGKVLKGFGYIFSEKILKFAVGFIVHAMVARFLGPSEFGKLSFVTKTVSVFYTFSLFGVDEVVLQHLMDKKYSRENILKTVLGIRLLMSFIGMILLGVVLVITRPESIAFSLLIFVYGIQIFIQAFNLFELDFQSRLSFKPLFWANNISNLFAAGLRVLGIWLKASVPYFVSTYLAGDILLKIIIQWKIGFQIFRGKFLTDVASKITQASWPHFCAAFVILFDQRISFIYIEKFLDSESLGNYSVAVTLVDLWIFLPTAVCSALFPTIVSVFKSNKEAYKIRIQYLSDIMVWMSLLFAVGVFVTADVVVEILYGQKYISAPSIIRWYSLVTLPMFFNLARMKWLAIENQLFDWLKLCALALVLNFILHRVLVPVYGVKGAVWGYLIAQIFANIVGCLFIKSARNSALIFIRTLTFPFRMLQKLN